MKNKRLNCWERKKCGREPGGENVESLGECPASTDIRVDGIHGGSMGGRACWALTGTFCGAQIQGTFASKIGGCRACDFYKEVMEEEPNPMDFTDILYKIKHYK